MHKARDRVLLRAFGPATLVKLYPHREHRQLVWEVLADSGEHMHLTSEYVAKLPAEGANATV